MWETQLAAGFSYPNNFASQIHSMADPIAPAEAEAAEAEAAEAEAAAAEAEIAEAEREAFEAARAAEAEIAEAKKEAAEAVKAAKAAEAEAVEAEAEAAEAGKAADALNALSGIYSSTELQYMLRSSKLTYFRQGSRVFCVFSHKEGGWEFWERRTYCVFFGLKISEGPKHLHLQWRYPDPW